MATTEIYLCRAGQELKQGRVEYSDSITTRAEAEADAIQRCRWDKRLAKVAYYAVNDEGDFKIILTYNNPNIGKSEKKKPKEVKKEPAKKQGLMTRMINAVTGSGSSKKKKKKTKKPAKKKSRT